MNDNAWFHLHRIRWPVRMERERTFQNENICLKRYSSPASPFHDRQISALDHSATTLDDDQCFKVLHDNVIQLHTLSKLFDVPVGFVTPSPYFEAVYYLHRIMSGFHGEFATGVASQQGTLTLPDTWFRPPFWDLLMLQLLRPNSSNLPCLYSTFHLEYPLVLSRFCFICGRRRVADARYRMICLVLLINSLRDSTWQVDYDYMCIWPECQTKLIFLISM